MSGAPTVIADYVKLEEIAKVFDSYAQEITKTYQFINQHVDELKGGAWVGRNADRFYAEMDNEVIPALYRLRDALEESADVTRMIIKIFQQAEEDGAAFFTGDTSGGISMMGAGVGAGTGTPQNTIRPPDYTAGNIPLYNVNISNPNFNAQAFVNGLNPGDRPVVFVVHGFNDNAEGYPQFTDYIQGQYGGRQPPPIVVGVEWDSSTLGQNVLRNMAVAGLPGAAGAGVGTAIGNYRQGEANAMTYGPRMGELLSAYNYAHPNSPVNVVAHSLGNGLTMNGIASHDVKINSFIAVQGAVDQEDIRPGGRLGDVLNVQEVGNLGVTYTPNDRAVGWARRGAGFGEGLGNYGGGENLARPEGTTRYYNMESSDKKWTGLNHYGVNDPVIQRDVIPNMWGANGEGLSGGIDPRFR